MLKSEYGVTPRLAAVLVGDDAASAVYVRNKIRACEEVGIASDQLPLTATTTTDELLSVVVALNQNDEVDGILVQLPLPKQIDDSVIIEAIDPAKDVDAFHPTNAGLLAMGRPRFVPCTPAGIIELLNRNKIEIAGASACVVGRSQIVGRPIAGLFLLARRTDLRFGISGYHGLSRIPVDLTFDLGVQADTEIGVMKIGFSTLIGFLPDLGQENP